MNRENFDEALSNANKQAVELGFTAWNKNYKKIFFQPWGCVCHAYQIFWTSYGSAIGEPDYEFTPEETEAIRNYLGWMIDDEEAHDRKERATTFFTFCDLSLAVPLGTTYAIFDVISFHEKFSNSYDERHRSLLKPFIRQLVSNFNQFCKEQQQTTYLLDDRLCEAVEAWRAVQNKIDSLPSKKAFSI